MNKHFTTREVSEKTGATLRQLQFWDEQGYIIPRREGHSRVYTARQLRTVQKLVNFRKNHRIWFSRFSLAEIGRAVIVTEPTMIGGRLVIPAAKGKRG